VDSHDLARQAADLALNKKAEDVVILDLRQSSLGTDYFVICSGNSDTQVKAIADEILEGMGERGQRVWRVEGYEACRWILLDYVDVVIHVFYRDTRSYYDLELLWGDVPSERVEESARPS